MITPDIILANLINRQSVTPDDAGCQTYLNNILQQHNFIITDLSHHQTTNTLAVLGKSHLPLFLFSAHTDVVPSGCASNWHTPPFSATSKDGCIYGRGTADMKGSLAAMIVALCKLSKDTRVTDKLRLGLIMTSDEEGDAQHGTKFIVKYLSDNKIIPSYCLVGEPSSLRQLGDNIRIGRRGSISYHLKLTTDSGHVAYIESQDNLIHMTCNMINDILNYEWQDHPDFGSNTIHSVNINSGIASNMTPDQLALQLNIRTNPNYKETIITPIIESIINKYQDNSSFTYRLTANESAQAFICQPGTLVKATQEVLQQELNISPKLDTGGGTSDARFIQEICRNLIELGPLNNTIHQPNEYIEISDLNMLTDIYYKIIKKICT